MKKNKIVTYPHKVLLAKAKPVEQIDQKIQNILDSMVKIMIDYNGIGLAAPQIGVSLRLITVRDENRIYKLINPEIARDINTNFDQEGCLSIPGEIWQVERATDAIVEGLDPDGKTRSFIVKQLTARVFQHEIDHLNGILINSVGKFISFDKDNKRKF